MILYLTARTSLDDLVIDFIEVTLATGETVSLNWDESEIERTQSGFTAKYKGVCFDEEYANGRLEQLRGTKIANVGLYTETEADFEITITEMIFEDGEESYEAECLPYVTDSGRCELT